MNHRLIVGTAALAVAVAGAVATAPPAGAAPATADDHSLFVHPWS